MLTDNQRRHIAQSLAHIEQTLTDACMMATQARGQEVFPRYRMALPEADAAALGAALDRLRVVLRRYARAQHLPTPAHGGLDPAWALDTQITLLRNVALELRPAHLAGYGALDEDAAHACRALAAEVGALLEGMQDTLRTPAGLPAPATVDALTALLMELVPRYRLGEYHARIAALAEIGDHVEVAVLGRVSSGKSSLLNALIQRALLPVGIVPVTTVTTRLITGAEPGLTLHYLDGHVEMRTADELAACVSEQGNPGNRMRLREVRMGLGALDWADGAVFTDTPGLGALQGQASAMALDYLPRCDLGMVLVDASATPTELERDLLLALRDAGTPMRVLLTKADLLTAEALRQQRDYVAGSLGAAVGHALEVDVLSSQPAWRAQLNAWREHTLRAQIDALRAAAAPRAAARARALGQQVLAGLRLAASEDARAAPAMLDSHALLALDQAVRQQHQHIAAFAEQAPAALLRRAAQARMDAQALGRMAADLAHQLAEQTRAAVPAAASTETAALPVFAWRVGALPSTPALATLRRLWQQHRLSASQENSLRSACRSYAATLHAWLDAATLAAQRTLRAGQSAGASDPAQLQLDIARLAQALGQPDTSATQP